MSDAGSRLHYWSYHSKLHPVYICPRHSSWCTVANMVLSQVKVDIIEKPLELSNLWSIGRRMNNIIVNFYKQKN